MLYLLPGERGMASDLSSGCTEVNDILDDEKEEGEISLEDVSSSEETPSYKPLPNTFGQCRYCMSMQHCATWCSSLTVNKNIYKRDAGLQGKENRSNRRYYKDGHDLPILGGSSTSKSIPYSSSTLQEKNDDDTLAAAANSDLVPISSDSDMEVVGLTYEKREKKSSHRRKLRKKRRKKSVDSLSLSLSPVPEDIALSIKDSIHRIEKDRPESGHSKYRHHSPDRKKFASRASPPSRRHTRSPLPKRSDRRRARSPLRKTSPVRSRKTAHQRKSSTLESDSPEKKTFNKLLKKVRKLEPSTRNKEKGSSLKDKLNNIIKHDKKESSAPNEKSKESSAEPDPKEESKESKVTKDEEEPKEPPIEEKKKKEEDEEDIIVLRQIALETKLKKNASLISPEDIKTEPVEQPLEPPASPQKPPPLSPTPPPSEIDQPSEPSEKKAEDKPEHKLPNFCIDENDEDLKLRMIALRSAVIKKHQTRIASGRRKKKKPEPAVPRIESPFTSTFIEDFPLLAEICSPTSPLSSKRDILSAEDMELDSDMELALLSGPEDQSPYSPSDDIIGELILEHEIAQTMPTMSTSEPIDMNRSLYSPSNPTETPAFPASKSMKHPEINSLDGSILEFTNQESRPYSPSDATVYDPDLPGVHSSVESTTLTTTTTTTITSLPLQPPPLPPLSMFGPRPPMLVDCPNFLNCFGDPMGMVPPPPMVTNFPALHQSVNPLLLPTTPPLFAYTPPQPTSVPPPSLPIPPTTITTTTTETNELDDFMETDLDGSPLVPIEKDSNEQRWPLLGEPLYLQNVPDIMQSNLSKLPTLMERNLVPAAVLRSNKQLQKQPFKKPMPPVGEALFRNAEMRPVALEEELDVRAASFKPIKLQPQPKRSVTTQPAAAFNSTLDDVAEEEEKLNKLKKDEEEKKERSQTSPRNKEDDTTDRKHKSKKSGSKHRSKELDSSRRSMRKLISERRKDLTRRVRERSCRLSRARSISRSISKPKRREEIEKKETPKSDDKKRRGSVDDDEEALRESLLASLAMKSKEQTTAPITPSPVKAPAIDKPSTESIPKSTDEMPLAERVSAFLAKSKEKDLKNSIAAGITTASTTTDATQPLRKSVKRLASMTPASKVVNNAKRYQNLINQRKLTQQMGSAAIKSRFKLSNTESRSASPVVTKPGNDVQKIVINLNEDTESESEREETKRKTSPVKVRPVLNIPTTDFEKSVDEFLKNARQQQELASTVNKNNIVSPKPDDKILIPMDPPPTSEPSTSKAITASATVTTAKITVATPPTVGSVGSIIATSPNTVAMAKDKIVSTPKITKITTKLPSVTATPTAVKHLTESTQEEYRRLKEILQRAKAKDSTSAIAQPQSSSEKTSTTPTTSLLSTTSSPSTCTTPALASSTPKTVMPPVSNDSNVSSLLLKPHEQVPVQNKPVPKTQLMATVSSMSKTSTEISKAPMALSKPVKIITSTKIIHTTSNISPNNIILNKSASVTAATTSTNKISPIVSPKVATTTLRNAPQSNNNMFINKHQAVLLGKMNEALSNQNKQISAVAQKVSSLTILSKDQINLKNSQVQQIKPNIENNVVKEDLNKITGNTLSTASKTFTGESNTLKSTKDLECATGANILKSNLDADNAKISSVETPCTTNKTKNCEDFREVVNNEIQALSHLPTQQQKELLSKTEENLIEKRRTVVDDIAEMSLKLREWEIERDLQYKYAEEAKKLRAELKKVEEKIQQQKNKLNTIHPQVSLYHKKINNGRKECFKLSKICSSLGQQIIGSDYNVPTAGAEVLNNRIKEVVKHTQKLQNKKTQYIDTVNNNLGKTDSTSSKKNSKLNNLSNRKEIIEQKNLSNNETVRLESNLIGAISTSKNEQHSMVNNNVNKCINEQIGVNPKIENEPMDTSTESLSTSTESTDNNNPLTNAHTELTSSVLNLNKRSNVEILIHGENSKTTTDSVDNLKIENVSSNINNNSEIENTNKIFNVENHKQLHETENIVSCSENVGNVELLAQKNEINTVSTINNSESELTTNVINFNDLANQKSVTQPSIENSISNTTNDENQNLSTVINTSKATLNEDNADLTISKNQTLQTVLTENHMIKIEREETAIESMEIPTSVESENILLEKHNANLNNMNTLSAELNVKSEVEKMELDSEHTNNESESQTSFNINNVEKISGIDNHHLLGSVNKEHEIKIKLEMEENTSSTSEIHNNVEYLSSTSREIDIIPVPELAEESVLSKKKSRNVKSTIKKKPTKAQQRKMYNKQVKLQLKAAENNTRSFEDTMKKGIQPYESILKPLRAPRNNTNGFLCPFEMQGTCNDGDCKYIHSSPR